MQVDFPGKNAGKRRKLCLGGYDKKIPVDVSGDLW